MIFRGLAYLAIVAALVIIGAVVVPRLNTERTGQSLPLRPTDASNQPGGSVPAPAVVPSGTPTPQPGTYGGQAYAPWAKQLAPLLNIPQLALQSYAFAQVQANHELSSCRLSWTMLAGIGMAESNHGTENGSTLNADGTSTPPIVGIPLDGRTTDRVTDTDDGRYDGDTSYDRAVGPMQFLPGTWRTWGVDVTGDGESDPFNINDASLATARYLCRYGGDLSTGKGWGAAVYAYNKSPSYVQTVHRYADQYARQSLAIAGDQQR